MNDTSHGFAGNALVEVLPSIVPYPEVDEADPLQTLTNCGGFYEAPSTGPLVGYAGTYPDANGETKHYVGQRYFNVAQAEQWPDVMENFSFRVWDMIGSSLQPNVILGAPMGGIIFGAALASQFGCRFVFAEKVHVLDGIDGQRSKESLALARHEIYPGERVGIAEDIANNFTTTAQLIELVVAAGGIPVFLACVVNRSNQTEYVASGRDPLPVISLVHRPTPQYRQDDPVVADLVAAGHVAWKPKYEWTRLKAAMDQSVGQAE